MAGDSRARPGPRGWGIDSLLALLVLIWGINYSLLKQAFTLVPLMAFNVMRFTLASVVLLVAIWIARRRAARGLPVDRTFYTPERITTRDKIQLVWLGVVGHCVYQWCFSGGLALTTVSATALIMATTPVLVSTAAALAGHERLRPFHWAGIITSLVGVTFVVGSGASLAEGSLLGDGLVCLAAVCWALFTFGGGPLMQRHSALLVSGVTTAVGTAVYTVFALPAVLQVSWRDVGGFVWFAVAFSGLLSIAVSYLIWYTAIQHIGPSRTSIYANMVPVVAMGIAAVWLREPLSAAKIIGAAAVLSGVVLTRLARPSAVVPTEE